jgi:hypothetical protein
MVSAYATGERTLDSDSVRTDQARATIDRIRRVPDTVRRFEVDVAAASRSYHIDHSLLEELLDLGLPHHGAGDQRRFDPLDLENISLGLNLPSPRRRALRWWSKSLLNGRVDVDTVYAVRLTAHCPQPGHPGECRFAVNPLLVSAAMPGSVRSEQPGVTTFDVHLADPDWYFGEPFSALIDRMTPLHFHVIPESLDCDLGFATATGLANCGLATRLTVHLAAEMDLPVRSVYGYFFTAPFLTWHTWCEFRCGERWIPADPFMLTALARWGVPGSERWAPNRSTGGLTWRLFVHNPDEPPARDFHAATHDGVPAPVTLMSQERPR